MNELRLIAKKTDHRCIGNGYEFIDTTHEFTYEDKPMWCEVKYRKAIGENQVSWRVFNADGMREWTEGKLKDKRKLQIQRDIKNWFDTNNIEWEATGCQIDYV